MIRFVLEIKKIKKNIELDTEIIQKFCQQEKTILLNIIPDKQFFKYTLSYNNSFKVLCLYRQNVLLKYCINNIDDLIDVNIYIDIIHKILCKIICEYAKKDNITKNEENYLLQFIYNFSRNIYTDIILNYYQYLPNRIQLAIQSVLNA